MIKNQNLILPNVSKYNNLFMNACRFGNVLYKQILNKYSIDIHVEEEYAFRYSCCNGHLEIAKHLVLLGEDPYYGKINIHAKWEWAFRISCREGHMEVHLMEAPIFMKTWNMLSHRVAQMVT